MKDKNELLEILAPYGQEHLLAFWDGLSPQSRESLAAQIEAIDFRLINGLFNGGAGVGDVKALADRAAEPPAFQLETDHNRISRQEARRRGAEALAAGEVAVLVVAGGQGTRLGFDHPKGMYPIGPVSGKTLFQIHVEKVAARRNRHGAAVPLCLMTSPATHAETLAYFDEKRRFGLPADDCYVFCQGTMPAVDAANGKVLLDAADRIATSPDGHGGMLAAIHTSGTLAALAARGVKYLFYLQVDNPLVDIGSPEFLGYHLLADAEATTQVVRKQAPLDRVGNVVSVDNRLHVIEYSDLPRDVAERRRDDGSLVVWAGSIAVHVFDLALLDRMARAVDGLPYHVAHKKVPYLAASGERIEPPTPNAVKFERFIFDLLPQARNAIVVEVDASRHFAPLKNAPGEPADTPLSVKRQISALHRQWLEQAGAVVGEKAVVEISPLVALESGDLAGRFSPDSRIDGSVYIAD